MSIPEMKEYAQELPYRMQAKQQLSKCGLSCVLVWRLRLCTVVWLRWCVCWCGHTQTHAHTHTHTHAHTHTHTPVPVSWSLAPPTNV